MDSYKITWKNSAKKELRKFEKETISKILKVVESLENNPYPTGVRKLFGSERTYRLRMGDYRIIYDVLEKSVIIEIIRVRHRKDAYRGK